MSKKKVGKVMPLTSMNKTSFYSCDPDGSPLYSTSYKGLAPLGTFGRCYEKHPALSLGEGVVIYGGSCSSPVVDDADVYIGLDQGMKRTSKGLPWTPGFEVYYPIQDMSVPKDPKLFGELIDWTADRLKEGLKVHVGCIGGHGRTGMVLSALVKVMLGEKDAIAYVRKHYCEKAVETDDQIKFLADVFGVTPVEARKGWTGGFAQVPKSSKKGARKAKVYEQYEALIGGRPRIVSHIPGNSIWD